MWQQGNLIPYRGLKSNRKADGAINFSVMADDITKEQKLGKLRVNARETKFCKEGSSVLTRLPEGST